MSEAEAEFGAIFRDEANERLDEMVETLVALETGEPPPDAIDALFRNAHTIKGAAGMFDLAEVVALAHAVEDVLGEARRAGSLAPELVEPLLRATDGLRAGVAGGDPAAADLVAALAVATCGRNGGGQAAAAAPPRRSAPEPQTLRVSAEKLDRLVDAVGETVLHRHRLEHAVRTRSLDPEQIADELGVTERLLDDLKEAAIGIRTLPLSTILGGLRRAVRDVAAAERRDVELVVEGDATELDRVILERLTEPLVHLLRNAVAHGIEPREERERAGKPPAGRIELRAEQRGRAVAVTVADDGRGVAAEALAEAQHSDSLVDVLCRPGFSTATEVTELAGRGVGLNAVKRHVEGVGGRVDVRSEPGLGTAVMLELPLALALLEVLVVERGAGVYGLPLASVDEVVSVAGAHSLAGRRTVPLDGRPTPLHDLAALLGAAAPASEPGSGVVVSAGGRRIVVACDRLEGQAEVLVKPLGPLLDGSPLWLGAAILGDGRIALLLDPAALVDASNDAPSSRSAPAPGRPAPRVLVVEDSFGVRELQRSILEAAGYAVETAQHGREALALLERGDGISLVVTDVEMPEMDGFELTERIRAHAEHAHLPVVIVTTRSHEDDRRRGIEAGADAYMTKGGFDQRALLETVDRLLGR